MLDELSSGDPYMSRRIETFSARFGYGRDKIVAKIASDEMFAAHFSKEPRRQGIHEKAADEWLEKLKDVENFEILPKSGKNAWYITGDGELRQGRRKHSGSSKSLDFRWRTGSNEIFAAHKFTKEEEAVKTISFWRSGTYWRSFRKVLKGMTLSFLLSSTDLISQRQR